MWSMRNTGAAGRWQPPRLGHRVSTRLFRDMVVAARCRQMAQFPTHQPPSATVVAELMRAGLSWSTAMAMDRWKAEEVLDLLRAAVKDGSRRGGTSSGTSTG